MRGWRFQVGLVIGASFLVLLFNSQLLLNLVQRHALGLPHLSPLEIEGHGSAVRGCWDTQLRLVAEHLETAISLLTENELQSLGGWGRVFDAPE